MAILKQPLGHPYMNERRLKIVPRPDREREEEAVHGKELSYKKSPKLALEMQCRLELDQSGKPVAFESRFLSYGQPLRTSYRSLSPRKKEREPPLPPLPVGLPPVQITTDDKVSVGPLLTEELRQKVGDEELLRRGRLLYHKGKVHLEHTSPERSTAEVEGGKRYAVTLERGLTGTCTCPAWRFSTQRFCKHMVAVAVALLFLIYGNGEQAA